MRNKTITVTTPEGIETFQMLARHGALTLEVNHGMKRRGRSVYAIIKESYGLKGSRARVLEQLGQLIDKRTGKAANDA